MQPHRGPARLWRVVICSLMLSLLPAPLPQHRPAETAVPAPPASDELSRSLVPSEPTRLNQLTLVRRAEAARAVLAGATAGSELARHPASTPQQATATVSFTPTVAAPGESIRVSGSGFSTSTVAATVRLVDLPATGAIATLGTAALTAGSFGPASLGIPSSVAAGDYRVQATDAVVTATSTTTLTVSRPSSVTVDTLILSAPLTETAMTSATFAFTGTVPMATFECALDGVTFAACSSPASYQDLALGPHHFEVRAVANSVSDPTPATWDWRVITATAPALPDLAVTAFAAGRPATGSLPVSVTVSNAGAADTVRGFHVHVFADRTTPPTITDTAPLMLPFSPLAFRASATVTGTLPTALSPGVHSLWALADGHDDVREADESNNVFRIQVTVEAVTAASVPVSTTALSIGDTVREELSADDGNSPLRGTGTSHFADHYTFFGATNQVVAIDLSSAAFDTYLYVFGPTGSLLTEDDDGGAGTDSRIPPGVGLLTLSAGGVYSIEVTSFAAGGTGAYTLTLSTAPPGVGLPDLVVAGMSAGPAEVGQSVPVTVTVANGALAPTGAGFHVHLFVDSSSAPTITDTALLMLPVPALAAGVSATVTSALAAGTLSPGRHTLWALADGHDAIAEADETNNLAFTAVDVPAIFTGTVVALSVGQTTTGTLSTNDGYAVLRGTGTSHFADRYTFSATAGLPVAIDLSSADFDTYVYLFEPTGSVLSEDDEGGAETDSRIPPESGFFTLPSTGIYTIEVTAGPANSTGVYTLTLRTTSIFTGTTMSLSVGQVERGTLSTDDGYAALRGTGTSHFADRYTFSGAADQAVAIDLSSAAFDAYLYLFEPAGSVLTEDDAGGPGSDARIPPGSSFIILPATGTYTVEVTSFAPDTTGAYTLTLTGTAVLLPDLIISDIAAAPVGVVGTTQVTVTVTNRGLAITDNAIYVNLFVDRSTPPTITEQSATILSFTPLAAGASLTVGGFVQDVVLSPGVHTLWALLDGNEFVTEADETNNTAVLTFTVQSDLVVASFEAEVLALDASVPFSVTVRNDGNVPTDAGFHVHLFVDSSSPPTITDTPLLMLSVPPLSAGASFTLAGTLAAGTLAPGAHTLWALADGHDANAEADETNNLGSVDVDVAAIFARSVIALSPGQPQSGALTAEDGYSPLRGTGTSHFADRYTFTGAAGQRAVIGLSSAAFDTYLYVLDPDGLVLTEDDDGGAGTSSRVPSETGYLKLPSTGTYVVEVTSFATNTVGAYTLMVTMSDARLALAAEPIRGAHAYDGGRQPLLGIQPVVALQDTQGMTLTADSSTVVTLTIKAGTGESGAVLSCAQGSGVITTTLIAGVTDFSGCAIDRPGSGYVLQATTADVPAAEGRLFNVTWAGDTNGTCRVSVADYSLVVTHFNKTSASPDWATGSPAPWQADVNGSGAITVTDYSMVITRFGTATDSCPLPSGP